MKLFKYLLLAILLVVVGGIAYFLNSINEVVKNGIETIGSDVLGVSVTVSSVDISIKEGSAEISGLNIGNPSGFKSDNAFSLGKVRLAIDTSSLTTDVIKINDISIVEPKINYEFANGTSNIKAIKANIDSKTSNDGSSSSGGGSHRNSKSFIIDNILFTDGMVNTYIGQLEKNVKLPEVRLQNIGNQSNPASARQVANAVMSQIVNDIAKNTDLNSLGADLKGAGNALKDKVKGLGGGIKGILGR